MPTGNKKMNSSPKKPSRRVAAWIYVVINPVVGSLGTEGDLLARGNLTWRCNTGECEYIRMIQEYVEVAQWPNYADFVHEYKTLREGFGVHDERLRKLNAAAKHEHDSLIAMPGLVSEVENSRTKYEAASGSRLSVAKDDLVKLSAEYVINNLESLPSHYLLSGFWKIAAPILVSNIRGRREFQDVEVARQDLSDISAKVRSALMSLRLSLGREYDVPAAPVPSVPVD